MKASRLLVAAASLLTPILLSVKAGSTRTPLLILIAAAAFTLALIAEAKVGR